MAASIFEKRDVDQLSLEEIDQVLLRYPYFSVLHYLRAAKLKSLQHGDSTAAVQKAALYFSNPFWFQYQLDRKEEKEEDADQEALAEIFTTPSDHEALELRETDEMPVAALVQEELEAEFDERRISETEEMYGSFRKTDVFEETPPETIQELAPVQVQEAHQPVEPVQDVPEPDEPVPAVETFDTPAPDELPDEVIPAVEDVKSLPVVDANAAPAASEAGTGELIPLEPLYTIDYFASQGIRLPAEEAKPDQLSVKLKSFTEWLRSMKKLHPEKIDKQMDQQTEQIIRASAEHSNERGDLYTEALAEVYVKQGLTERAVEVYQKLSLLDPGKSAYFAARIREIKDI